MSVCKRTSKRTGRRAAYLAVAATLLAAPGLAIAGGWRRWWWTIRRRSFRVEKHGGNPRNTTGVV